MSVKLMGGMPKGEHNGLAGQEERIEDSEGTLIPLVILADISLLGRHPSTDEAVVQLKIAEVEIADREKVNEILRAARKDRTGAEELDFDGLEGGGDDE